MEYSYPLVAIHSDGTSRLFYDVESFLVFAYDRRNGGVGGYWREGYIHQYWKANKALELVRFVSNDIRGFHEGNTNTWIVRDNDGRVVDKKLLGSPARNPPYWSYGHREDVHRAAEQGLPIPYTGQRRRWRSGKRWTKNGRNGAHNQRKGIRCYEDPLIRDGDFDQF